MPGEAKSALVDARKAKIFISYSRKDLAFADRLDMALKARGFEPLIDRTEIYAFEDWWKAIEGMIGSADTIVFVLSPNAVASKTAVKEIEYAASLNKRLAPVVCDKVADDLVPEPLRRLNFIYFEVAQEFELRIDQLAEALQTDIGWVRLHTEYGEDARRWSASQRPDGLLLRSPALEEAEHWIASRPRHAPAPTQETQDFIAESRRGASRRRNALTGSLAAGLALALVLAGIAVWQRNVAVAEKSIAQAQTQLAEEQTGIAVKERQAADEQRQQVVDREMKRRAALAQELASAGRTKAAVAVALDAMREGQKDLSPIPELQAAIRRSLHLTKIPVERYLGDNVFNLAISPDGRTLAAGTVKGRVFILDAVTLEPRFELNNGTDVVSGLDFSPDGKRLVAAGDKIPNVWNVETGERLFDLQRPEARRSAFHAQFSPNGKIIAVATSENRVLLHDGLTGKLLHVLPGASYDEMLDRWKSKSKDDFGVADPIVDALNRANFQIWGAATDAIFSPDGRLVAITGPSNPDGSVRLFDSVTGNLVRTLTGGRGAAMTPPFNYGSTFAFSPDGSSLMAAPVAVTIKVWNVESGELRAELPIRSISSFLLTADGAALVIAHENGSLTFRCLTPNLAEVSLQAHDGAIDSLSVDRAGRILATGSTDQTARLWRMPKSSDICGYDQPDQHFDRLSVLRPTAILAGHGARITKVVFSSDEQTVVTASQDGWVRGWSLAADPGTTNIILPDAGGEAGNTIASADGRSIYAYQSGRWYGWDTRTGQPIKLPDSVRAVAPGKGTDPILFESPFSQVDLNHSSDHDIGFSSWHGPASVDGSRIVATGEDLKTAGAADVPFLVDGDTKKVLARLVVDGRSANDLSFSSDGTRLFGRLERPSDPSDGPAGDGLAVWDAKSGSLVATVGSIPNYGSSTPRTISRDGRRLLLAPDNKDLLLYQVVDQEFKAIDFPDTNTNIGSGLALTASNLSPDGNFLLVGRSDGVILVADIRQNAIWRVLETQKLPVDAVAMSEPGRYVAATDESNTLWVFDADNGEPIRSATFAADIVSMFFLPATDQLAVFDARRLSIFPAVPSFDGTSDINEIVSSARKLGFNLVSEEDRQRYKLGSTAAVGQSSAPRWAALDPNSEGTAPVVWAESEDEARKLSISACQKLSNTCAQNPAMTSRMESSFVFYCCAKPRLGCAVTSGSGDSPLRSVKEILARAKYSSCEVRTALSARDGTPR